MLNTLTPKAKKILRKRGQKDCETASPSNVKSYIPKVSPTWLSKYEINEDDTNEHAKCLGDCP